MLKLLFLNFGYFRVDHSKIKSIKEMEGHIFSLLRANAGGIHLLYSTKEEISSKNYFLHVYQSHYNLILASLAAFRRLIDYSCQYMSSLSATVLFAAFIFTTS